MSKRRFHFGFTLIELVLVLMLLGVVAAAAVPSLTNWGRGRRLTNTADDILVTTRWARSQAITSGQLHRVEFDVENGSFGVARQIGTTWEPVQTELGRTRTLEPTIRIEVERADGDGTAIDLWPTGRVSPLEIVLTDEWGGVEVLSSPGAAEPLARMGGS